MGLFVLIAMALLVLAGILFGGGRFFQEKIYFETYFDTSVQGLEKGSAVQLRGVRIGEVESISFASVAYSDDLVTASPEDRKALRYVRVLCSIDVNKHPNFSKERLEDLRDQSGLVTRLSLQGITGGMMVNLDFVDKPAPPLKFAWTPETTYIPSYPTTLENIISVTEKISEKLEDIDFSETIAAITTLTNQLTKTVEASNIAAVSESVTRCATQVESLAKHLDEIVVAAGPEAIGEDLKTTLSALASLSQTLDQTVPSLTMEATETMASINEVTTELSPIVKAWGESEAMLTLPEDTSGAVQQVLQTLRVLEALLQSLRERPSRIIFDDEMQGE